MENLTVGNTVRFVYNARERNGEVIKMCKSFLVLKLASPEEVIRKCGKDITNHKSFNFSKIEKLEILSNVA